MGTLKYKTGDLVSLGINPDELARIVSYESGHGYTIKFVVDNNNNRYYSRSGWSAKSLKDAKLVAAQIIRKYVRFVCAVNGRGARPPLFYEQHKYLRQSERYVSY